MSKVEVEFGAKDVGLSSTIAKVRGSMDGLDKDTRRASDSVTGGFKKMAAGAAIGGAAIGASMLAIQAATRAAMAVVRQFGDALEMGGRLNDLSAQTGETAGNLLILERAFQNTGLGSEKVGTSINKLQKFLNDVNYGSQRQNDALKALGLTMADLAGKTPTEQMRLLAQQVMSVEDPTVRAGLAMEVFGRAGGKLLPLLANFDGEIKNAKGELGSLPGVMDRSNAAFDAVGDRLAAIRGKLTEFAAGLLEQALPALDKFTQLLVGLDAAEWGGNLMARILQIADTLTGAFQQPMAALSTLWDAASLSFRGFLNTAANGFSVIGAIASDVFASRIPELIAQSGADAWDLFVARGESAFAKLQKSPGVNGWAAAINATLDFGATDENGGSRSWWESFDKYADAGKNANAEVIADLEEKIQSASRKFEDGLVSGAQQAGHEWNDIISNVQNSPKDIFGVTEAGQKLKDDLAAMEKTGKDFREQVTKATSSAKDDTPKIKTDLELGAMAMEKAAKAVKETLTLSQQLIKDIAAAEKKNAIDPGGKLEKEVRDQTESGNYAGARRAARKLADEEAETELRGQGENRDRRSIRDIAKARGISTTRKTDRQLRDEINNTSRQRQEELKPGKEGEKTEPGGSKKDSMSDLAGDLRTVVNILKKIEPKLPQISLAP